MTSAYGRELRRLRLAKGMTQRELAHWLSVGFPHISKVETGRERPSISFVVDAHRIAGGQLPDLLRLAERCEYCGGKPELGFVARKRRGRSELMSGWQRREVAIPVPQPAPLIWAGTDRDRDRQGAAEHWADWQPDNQLMILRPSIPVRATDPNPAVTAITRAFDHWNSGRFALGLANLDGSRLMAWTWDPADHGKAAA